MHQPNLFFKQTGIEGLSKIRNPCLQQAGEYRAKHPAGINPKQIQNSKLLPLV